MNRRWLPVAPLTLCSVFFSVGLASADSDRRPAEPVSQLAARQLGDFVACQLVHPDQVRSFSAECVDIELAERAGAERRIRLSLIKLPAVSRRQHADPIVLLAGGPGGDVQSMYTQVAGVFDRAGRTRDILLLDQRGTGRSTPLRCPQTSEDLLGSAPAEDPALFFVRSLQCRDDLANAHDLTAYTTSHAVRDLEAVRALLGYDALNIYAISYGTRVAQHYARRYPQRVRSMVLDGVVAPATILGPSLALHAELALTGVFARCAADAGCAAAFPDLKVRTRRLLNELERQPRPLSLPHPRNGTITAVNFGADHLRLVLRLGSYQSAQAALLPLAVSQAEQGDYRTLFSLFMLTAESLAESIAVGMHNTVVCSEDLPRFDPAALDRDSLRATYLGVGMIDAMQRVCADWPRGFVDADFHEPLQTDSPVLLLSGSLDPVTPPADAAKVAASLTNARHIVLPEEGHGQLGIRCMDRVLADFFATPNVAALDASCLDRKRVPPFWLSLAGPAP